MPAAELPPEFRDNALDALRGDIDVIDELLVSLVRRRTRLALRIAAEKRRDGTPTMVSGRHGEVITHYIDAAEDGTELFKGEDAAALGELVMGVSRDAQDRFRAGTLGDEMPGDDQTVVARLAQKVVASMQAEREVQ